MIVYAIMTENVMMIVNQLFGKYGLDVIENRIQESIINEDWDLPF